MTTRICRICSLGFEIKSPYAYVCDQCLALESLTQSESIPQPHAAEAVKAEPECPIMLREQIRVADVAFNRLHNENKDLLSKIDRLEAAGDAMAQILSNNNDVYDNQLSANWQSAKQ